MKKLVAMVVMVIMGLMGTVITMTGVAGADVAGADVAGADVAGADEGVQCWIPQPQQPIAPAVTRQRADGTWEVLVVMDRHTAEGLCVQVLDKLWVYVKDVEDVEAYLHGLNGEVLFFGEWVKWSPMLWGLAHVASCESGGNWHIVNAESGAAGLFQILGMDPNTEPQAQLDLAYSVYDRQGWGAWGQCARRFGLY